MKFGGDFFLSKRQAVPLQTIAGGGSLNGADVDCRDFMEALFLLTVGQQGAAAELSVSIEKKNRVTAAYSPLLDKDGNAVALAAPLIESSPNDPSNKTLRIRVDCRALPEDENIIRLVLGSAVEASPVSAVAVFTTQYEHPDNADENAAPLADPILTFSTKQALIQPSP